MVFKALQEPIEVEAQTFEPFERKGFTVVERGGSELQFLDKEYENPTDDLSK